MPVFLADMVIRGFWWAILASFIFAIPFSLIGEVLKAFSKKNGSLVCKVLGNVMRYASFCVAYFYIWQIRGSPFWLILGIICIIMIVAITLLFVKDKRR